MRSISALIIFIRIPIYLSLDILSLNAYRSIEKCKFFNSENLVLLFSRSIICEWHILSKIFAEAILGKESSETRHVRKISRCRVVWRVSCKVSGCFEAFRKWREKNHKKFLTV